MSPRLRPRLTRRWAAAGLAVAVAATGVAVALALAPQASAAILPNGFKSVGYMPSWAGSVNSHPVQQAHPHQLLVRAAQRQRHPAGRSPNTAKLSSLVSLAHANNVRVSIAVGGWNDGNDSAFEALAANATARTTFVNSLVNLVNQYGLDGVDMDWEYPDPGTSGNNFTAADAAAQHGDAQPRQAAHRGRRLRRRHRQRRTAGGLRLRRLAQHHGVRRRQPARQLRLGDRRRQLLEVPRPARGEDRARRAVLQPTRRHHLLLSWSR